MGFGWQAQVWQTEHRPSHRKEWQPLSLPPLGRPLVANKIQFSLTLPKGRHRKVTVEEGGPSSKLAGGWEIWLRNGQDQGSLRFLICIMGIATLPASQRFCGVP